MRTLLIATSIEYIHELAPVSYLYFPPVNKQRGYAVTQADADAFYQRHKNYIDSHDALVFTDAHPIALVAAAAPHIPATLWFHAPLKFDAVPPSCALVAGSPWLATRYPAATVMEPTGKLMGTVPPPLRYDPPGALVSNRPQHVAILRRLYPDSPVVPLEEAFHCRHIIVIPWQSHPLYAYQWLANGCTVHVPSLEALQRLKWEMPGMHWHVDSAPPEESMWYEDPPRRGVVHFDKSK